MNALLSIVILLAIVGGIIFLQIYLSKQPNPWFGLIFPFVSFLISIFILLGIAAFSTMTTTEYQSSTEIEANSFTPSDDNTHVKNVTSTPTDYRFIVFTFMITNIPTLILILIYVIQRRHIKAQNQLERMSIQDLE